MVKGLERIRAGKGVGCEITKHRATRPHGVGAFDPLEKGPFDADVLGPVFPSADTLSSIGVRQVGQMLPRLRECGNVLKAAGLGVSTDRP
eukprot:5611256-Alexandrium_andersonii.AAC.1